MLKTIGFVIVVVCFFATFVFWCAAIFYMFRTVVLRKPGVDLWRDTLLNPFNLLILPSRLSEAGLVSRKRCFLSLAACLAFAVLAAIVGFSTGAVH